MTASCRSGAARILGGLLVAAAPDYLARHGRPRQPADLARRLDWRLPEPYAWSPKRALAMLPRPRWRLRGKPASGRGRHGPADRPA